MILAGRHICLLALAVIAGFLATASPALVRLEAGRQVDGLWIFPRHGAPEQWVYLPTRARLVEDEAGDPRFSFTFFVESELAGEASTVETIGRADGGAILHFLVTYDAPRERIEAAEDTLRTDLDDESVEIVGPVLFETGQYTVVSSSLTGGGGSPAPLQTGSAPVLAGDRLALSFRLSPENADILLATFRTDTPDLSVAFELQYAGLTRSYSAEMVVDWEKAQESLGASLGGSVYVVSAEAKTAIDRLRNDGAITLEVEGDDPAMDRLVDHVYNKALELMFAPIEPAEVPEAQQAGLLEALGAAVGTLGDSEAGAPVPFSVGGAFRLKDLRTDGETRLSFDKRARVLTRSMVTTNLGDLHARYGADQSRFRVVAVGDDPVRQRRVVHVGLDGALVPEFDHFVDALEVTLRKRHPTAPTTVEALQITRDEAEPDAFFGPLSYGNVDAEPPESWREYSYQTAWQFRGGADHVSDWRQTTAAPLIVSAPFERQDVWLMGAPETLQAAGVRALVAQVSTDLFGDESSDRQGGLISQFDLSEPLSLVHEKGDPSYAYDLVWIFEDGARRRACGRDDTGLLFIDLLPEPGAEPTCGGR